MHQIVDLLRSDCFGFSGGLLRISGDSSCDAFLAVFCRLGFLVGVFLARACSVVSNDSEA